MVASRGVECSTLGGLGPRLRASFLSYADLGKSEFPPIGKTHGSRFLVVCVLPFWLLENVAFVLSIRGS